MQTLKWGIFAYISKRGCGEWSWYLKGEFTDYDHAMLYALRTNNHGGNFAIMLLNERGERLLRDFGEASDGDPVKWAYYEPMHSEFDGNPLLYGTFTHGQMQMPLTPRAADDPESEGYSEFWRTSGFKIDPMMS